MVPLTFSVPSALLRVLGVRYLISTQLTVQRFSPHRHYEEQGVTMYLLIALLFTAIAYEAAETLNRLANLATTEPHPYLCSPSRISK